MHGGVRGRGLITPSYSIVGRFSGSKGILTGNRELWTAPVLCYNLNSIWKAYPRFLSGGSVQHQGLKLMKRS